MYEIKDKFININIILQAINISICLKQGIIWSHLLSFIA